MEQFKCKMFSIELYNFLLISVTDRIVLKRNVYILPYVKSTEHQKMTSNESIIRDCLICYILVQKSVREVVITCGVWRL